MEKEPMEDEIEQEETETKPKMAGTTKLLIGLGSTVVILLMVVAGGLGYLISGGPANSAGGKISVEEIAEVEEAEEFIEEEDARKPEFTSLRPTFTANFKVGEQAHYLQIAVDVMARDKEIIEKAEELMPIIRHRVLEILSRQDAAIYTAEGKDVLRQTILESLQEVVVAPSGTIEGVFFTSFVIQ